MYRIIPFAIILLMMIPAKAQNYVSKVWSPDLGNGKYKNPVIFADYSDLDMCKAGNDYYMTASSFGCVPESKNKIINLLTTIK